MWSCVQSNMAFSFIDTEAWKGDNETETSLQHESAIVMMAWVFIYTPGVSVGVFSGRESWLRGSPPTTQYLSLSWSGHNHD